MDPISVPIKIDAKVNADLKDATNLAGKTINTIARACGILYEPIGIVRKAKAEANAAIIRTTADAELREILQRAGERFVAQQVRQQQNVDVIVAKALEQPQPNTVSEEPCDTDWVNEFIDCSKNISNEQMQGLMAKILAGEVAQPGSFSRRTIHLVRTLGKRELEAFGSVCAFGWDIHGGDVVIPWDQNVPQHRFGEVPDYGSILECQSMGLLHDHSALQLTGPTAIDFYGRRHSFRPDKEFRLACYSLTPSGGELKSVVPTTPSMDAYRYWLERWRGSLDPHGDIPPAPAKLRADGLDKMTEQALDEAIKVAVKRLEYWTAIANDHLEKTKDVRLSQLTYRRFREAVSQYDALRNELHRRNPDAATGLPEIRVKFDERADG